MADPSFALQQQEQILRDIRDELRQGRQQAAGQSMMPGRPSPGFVQAQMTVDRMVAGEWATLGWANAYQTPIKSSLANDLMGAMGLRAAPQSMWQREYELMSSSMLADRVFSFPTDLVMPGFGRRSRDMGANIYQLSGRLNRTGDNTHTTFHGAMSLARDLQIEAARDLRLSGRDYNEIFNQSAQAGQFDFSSDLSGVKSQFNDLRNAVADLTKSLRIGAGEVSQTLGAFRQFGIVDIADQRRMAERMGISARVAGLSTPEMAAITRAGIESGMPLGLGAAGSAALAQNLAMAARDASRSGLISGHVMAAAGGVQGMVQSQQNAINQFAASGAGFYTALGGGMGDGDALANMIAGVGAAGGTMRGVMASEARRLDFMGGLSGAQRQRLFNRNIDQQLRMLGVDPMGEDAADYAFSLIRGQMGDAAGLSYARQNYSAQGRRQRWAEQYRMEYGAVQQDAQRNYQMWMENESMFGLFRQGVGEIGAGIGSVGRSLGRAGSYVARHLGSAVGMRSGTFEQAQDTMGLLGDDALGVDAAAAAAVAAARGEATGESHENRVKIMGAGSGLASTLTLGAAAGGGLVGAKAGAWAGGLLGAKIGLIGGPMGSVIGGTVGALAGAGLAFTGASALLPMGLKAIELSDGDATNYRAALRGSTGGISQRAINIAQGNNAGLAGLSNSASFHKIMARGSDMGTLSAEDSLNLTREMAAAAKESGLDVETVAGVVRSMGVDYTLQADYTSNIAGSKRYEERMHKVMDGVEGSGLSIASAEVAAGVQAYAGATTNEQRFAARAKLSAAGITGRSMHNLMTALDALSTDERTQLASDAGSYVTQQGQAMADRRFLVLNKVAQSLATEATAMGAAGGREALTRLQQMQQNPRELLDLMMGGGDQKDATLRDFLIRQDETGTMAGLKEIGSMQDLMEASNDDRLMQLSGLDREKLQALRTTIARSNLSEADKPGAMRQAISSMMLSQSQAVKTASSPESVAANNMLLAANILREIQQKISGDASTKGEKK